MANSPYKTARLDMETHKTLLETAKERGMTITALIKFFAVGLKTGEATLSSLSIKIKRGKS